MSSYQPKKHPFFSCICSKESVASSWVYNVFTSFLYFLFFDIFFVIITQYISFLAIILLKKTILTSLGRYVCLCSLFLGMMSFNRAQVWLHTLPYFWLYPRKWAWWMQSIYYNEFSDFMYHVYFLYFQNYIHSIPFLCLDSWWLFNYLWWRRGRTCRGWCFLTTFHCSTKLGESF